MRQRRNLIAISTFLVLFDIANVRVAKVSLLGNELIVGNVPVLIYIAWCLWGYFLLRYYQYWRTEPDKYIRSAFGKYFDSLTHTYSREQAANEDIEHGFTFKIIRNGLLSWSFTTQCYSVEKGSIVDVQTSPLPLWRLIYWRIKSALHVVFQTPHVTDRVLPFIVAISAPIVVFIKKCPYPWPWLWELSQSNICI